MTVLRFTAIFYFTFSLVACGISAADEMKDGNIGFRMRTSRLTDPTEGNVDQAQGFYSKGSMKNSDTLSWDGPGFVKILRPRSRRYATHDMIYILSFAAARMRQLHPSTDRLMIGDMSNEEGGFAYGHASHQNGLDADIAYYRKDQTEQDPETTTGFLESFVKGGRLTENFDLARNWALVKILVSTNRVERIFANAVVKKALCKYAKSIGEFNSNVETLRRVREYSGHTDHYHVRLSCPQKSPKCETQAPVPPGSGCI